MKKLFYLAISMLCIIIASSCDQELLGEKGAVKSDTIRILKDYEYIVSLAHHEDSSKKVEYTDLMDSKLTVWATQNGQRLLPAVYDNVEHPTAHGVSVLSLQDYATQEQYLNCEPISSQVLRGQRIEKDGTVTELDTIIYEYPDKQRLMGCIEITNKQAKVGNETFDYPSLTMVGHEWQYRKDTPRSKTRAEYMSGDYSSEHKYLVFLRETNIENPKTLAVPLYAFTSFCTMKEDELVRVDVDTTRVWVDPETEKVTIDLTEVYTSDITISQTFERLCKHLFSGDEPYSKDVTNWNHKHSTSSDIAWEAEKNVESDSLWTVYGKNGVSYENYENGVVTDKAPAKFKFYVERPVFKKVYKDTTIVVNFGYAPINKQEMQNSITAVESDKEGMNKAILKSFLSTVYLGGGQTLNDDIYLYMSNEDIKEEDVTGKMYVKNDSVCADIINRQTLMNGDVREIKDHWAEPWTIVNTTDWTSVQEVLSQDTEDTVTLNLIEAVDKNRGNWYWKGYGYNLLDYTTLHNGEKMLNGRTVTFPNELSYRTPNGKTFTFEVMPYKVDEKGAQLKLKSTDNGSDSYDFTEDIEEHLGGYTRPNTAHGTLIITSEKIVKKEARNKVQTVLDDKVRNEFDRVYITSSNKEIVDHITHEFPRTRECTSNWKATAKLATESTGQPTSKLLSKAFVEDDLWSCDMQTRGISANVTGTDYSVYNEWTAKDPNFIKYVEEGLIVEFDEIKFSVAYVNSGLSLKETKGLDELYTYNNTINIVYGNNTTSISAPGTLTVNKNKEVVDRDIRDKRYIITDDAVTAVGKLYSIYNDGTEDFTEVSKSAPRTKRPYTNWTAKDINSSVLTGSASVKLLSSDAKKDGAWSWDNDKHDTKTLAQLQSSTQTNGVETVDPNRFKYEVDGKVFEWGEINFSASEAGQNVKLIGDNNGVTSYGYTDDISLIYGTNVQTVTLPGTINVEISIVKRTIISTEQNTSSNGVNSIVKVRNEWSNGNVTEQTFEKFFDGNLRCITNWSSEEDNADQTTGSASISLLASSQRSDGEWLCYDESERITTETRLNGSTQTNAWESKFPKRIVFETADGLLKHDFGTINFSVQETGANVTKRSENADGASYDFTDNIGLIYGNSNFSSSAPGEILVKTPWNPDFRHGKFVACYITTARNEARNTWVYVASVHFETGTMPLIIRQNANAPEINEDYFEEIVDSRLNSGTWVPKYGKWINSIAEDTPDLMQWFTVEGYNADNMAYPTATAWGWDFGHTVSGHPSVTTDKFSAKITDGGYVLTIYSGNKVFATYKAAKD